MRRMVVATIAYVFLVQLVKVLAQDGALHVLMGVHDDLYAVDSSVTPGCEQGYLTWSGFEAQATQSCNLQVLENVIPFNVSSFDHYSCQILGCKSVIDLLAGNSSLVATEECLSSILRSAPCPEEGPLIAALLFSLFGFFLGVALCGLGTVVGTIACYRYLRNLNEERLEAGRPLLMAESEADRAMVARVRLGVSGICQTLWSRRRASSSDREALVNGTVELAVVVSRP